jgi:hypothetical protein
MDNSFGTILPGGTSEKAFIASLQPMLPLGQYVIDTLGHKYVYVTKEVMPIRYSKNGYIGYFGNEYHLSDIGTGLYLQDNMCIVICDIPSYDDLGIPLSPTKNVYVLAKILEQKDLLHGGDVSPSINDIKSKPQTLFDIRNTTFNSSKYRQYIQTSLSVRANNAAGTEVYLTLSSGTYYFGKFKNINGIKTLIKIGPVKAVAASEDFAAHFEPKGIPELNSDCEYFSIETDLVLNGTLNQENIGTFGAPYA